MGTITASIYLTLPRQAANISNALNRAECEVETDSFEGGMYPFQAPSSRPAWAYEIQSTTSIQVRGQYPVLQSQTAGALLIFSAKNATSAALQASMGDRRFIVSFGAAWQRLNDDWLEPNFGRTVALNVLTPDQLLELRTEQIFALRHTATDRAPTTSAKSSFDLDSDRDLLEVLEGKLSARPLQNVSAPVPLETLLSPGSRVRGGQSLRIAFDLANLDTILAMCLVEFHSTAYRALWPEVDYLVPVDDTPTRLQLDDALDRQLRAFPWPVELKLVAHGKRNVEVAPESFAIGRKPVAPRGGTIPTQPFLSENDWRRYLQSKSEQIGLVAATDTPVHCFDGNLQELFATNIYACLATEASHAGNQYFLSEGRWFRADIAFLATLSAELTPFLSSNQGTLPPWDQIAKEGPYNEATALTQGWVHLDAKNVHYGGGQSKFELCDFLDPNARVMYFVKKSDTSAPLSHLCEQVRRTVELVFSSDSGFRAALGTYATRQGLAIPQELIQAARPAAANWRLALVVLTRNRVDPLQRLPLFAKCSLRRVAKQMSQLGHPVDLFFP